MELEGIGRGRLRAPWPLEVEALEVYERRGDGHTLARHCGVSPAVEVERLERHRQLPATGSFPDAVTAQRCVEACVDARRADVESWRRGPTTRLAMRHELGEVIGDVLQRSALLAGNRTPAPATAVRVVLRRNGAYPSGFAVLTAYPVLDAVEPYPRQP